MLTTPHTLDDVGRFCTEQVWGGTLWTQHTLGAMGRFCTEQVWGGTLWTQQLPCVKGVTRARRAHSLHNALCSCRNVS